MTSKYVPHIPGDAIFLARPTSTVPRNIFFVEERGWLFDDPCTIPVGGGFIERPLEFFTPKKPGAFHPPT